ncbi:DNA cytosine methyltransferase [Undibacterium sp. SXout11W]|uniref:DNA cytosine methyltransferase n=1 Tax=Undibacterium sp. SXout11W TaxID=3413050 RepID=UPI003BF1BAB2
MNKPLKNKRLRVIDLFSGAGGFSLAALNSNYDIVAAIEYDKDACDTYRQNIINKNSQETLLYQGDIRDINPNELLDDLKLKSEALDLIIGGPPCQGFSTHRINDSGVDDPRNELLLKYFDFVAALRPKAFLVENVPGLLWERHKQYLDKFKALAKEHNYTLKDPHILDAKNYGVPQNRKRVFLLGIRNDIETTGLEWPPEQTHFSPKFENATHWVNSSIAFEAPPKYAISELIKVLGREQTETLAYGVAIPKDNSAVGMKHTTTLTERFKNTPINGSRTDNPFHDVPCHSGDYAGHKDVYGRIKLAQPSPTITTGCFNPSKGRFLHPWKDHGITIRHAARLQTFPDDFEFSGGITSQGKQVGNAVPIKLGEALLNNLNNFLSQR